MTSVLLTAFKSYGPWSSNSSWLAMVELTKLISENLEVKTRLYSVDFKSLRKQLELDLEQNFDVALHLGQSPAASSLQLESIGLNVAGESGQLSENFTSLDADGPVAYRSSLPLDQWAIQLRQAGIPARLSYHAGTYLCNATLYWSQRIGEVRELETQSAFVHLPLAPSQVLSLDKDYATMSSEVAAQGIRLLLKEIEDH